MKGLVLIFGLFPLLSVAQSLSLEEAIRISLENVLSIQIAEKDFNIAQNSDNWATAGRTGNIDLNLTGQSGYSNSQNPFSTTESINLTVTPAIQANVLLYGGHQVRLTKEQLNKAVQVSQGNLQVEVENTIRNVVDSYLAASLQKEQLSVLQQVKALSRDRMYYEEVKKDFGQSGRFEYLTAQDAYLNDSITFRAQLAAYENALSQLQLAMQSSEAVGELADSMEISTDNWTEDNLIAAFEDNNQTLKNQALAKDLSRINLDLQF